MRIVLTGGPMAGKSAVLKELSRRGFAILVETAANILARRHAGAVVASAVRSIAFNDLVLQEQLAAERALPSDRITIMDRSVLDNMAYRRLFGLERPETRPPHDYAAVFLLDILPTHVWPREVQPTADARLRQAREIEALLIDEYRAAGYAPERIAFTSVAERATWIAGAISRMKRSGTE
jgi:predicted ATPase